MPELAPAIRSAVDELLNTDAFRPETGEAALNTVVDALGRGELQLLDLVVYLEKVLSDTSNHTGRRQAVRLLTECLKNAVDLRLNFKHVETFMTYFLSKLGDWHCVEFSLGGVFCLLQRHGPVLRTLQVGDVPIVTHAAMVILRDVNTRSHTQQVRKLVLEVVGLLLDEWREELALLEGALGEGVNAIVDEERDPRNLMLSFGVARTLFANFGPECTPQPTFNTIFESVTSYFPITFTPPKDDKFGISGDDLRGALSAALGASPRLAGLVVPFLVDSSKDIVVGDSEATIVQALETLGVCLESYGPATARGHIKNILETARDQVTRTETPCVEQFCTMVKRVLAVVLQGVRPGLHPHWLSTEVDPVLDILAEDAKKDPGTLAARGARSLLLAAAAAHPIILERVWAIAVAPALAKAVPAASSGREGVAPPQGTEVLQPAVLPLVMELVPLIQGDGSKPRLAQRQLIPLLHAAHATLLATRPASLSGGFADEVTMLGRLCLMSGEEVSGPAFRALCMALLPSSKAPVENGDDNIDIWSNQWRLELSSSPDDGSEPRLSVLVDAVAATAATSALRASDLAPHLLAMDATGRSSSLPRLLAAAALSLARPRGEEDAAADEPTAAKLLARAATLLLANEAATAAVAAQELAEALEALPSAAREGAWAAEKLAEALGLPAKLPRLCAGLVESTSLAGEMQPAPARRLMAVLAKLLTAPQAKALRQQVFKCVLAGGEGDVVVALVPASLPASALEDWPLCREALPAVCRLASNAPREALEPLALAALEALVEACPQAEVDGVLDKIRLNFGALLECSERSVAADPRAARGAARCWAAVAGALLRRGGFGVQVSTFLNALLAALETGGAPVTPFVPVAFRVLLPPTFGAEGDVRKPGLPSLALQRLSHTALPPLLQRAKESGSAEGAAVELSRRVALESAVALLAGLPAATAAVDFGEEVKWCTLAGLRRMQEDGGGDDATFVSQVLQLLLRALRRSEAWVEDHLNSVVPPLTAACAGARRHRVPLVRLACLQALHLLVLQSHGHLAPFRKQIALSTKLAVEDKRREVRLVAVACLNAWHCGAVPDD